MTQHNNPTGVDVARSTTNLSFTMGALEHWATVNSIYPAAIRARSHRTITAFVEGTILHGT